jgi:hypothetical protein
MRKTELALKTAYAITGLGAFQVSFTRPVPISPAVLPQGQPTELSKSSL